MLIAAYGSNCCRLEVWIYVTNLKAISQSVSGMVRILIMQNLPVILIISTVGLIYSRNRMLLLWLSATVCEYVSDILKENEQEISKAIQRDKE